MYNNVHICASVVLPTLKCPRLCFAAQTEEGARTSPYHKSAKLAKPLALVKMTLDPWNKASTAQQKLEYRCLEV